MPLKTVIPSIDLFFGSSCKFPQFSFQEQNVYIDVSENIVYPWPIWRRDIESPIENQNSYKKRAAHKENPRSVWSLVVIENAEMFFDIKAGQCCIRYTQCTYTWQLWWNVENYRLVSKQAQHTHVLYGKQPLERFRQKNAVDWCMNCENVMTKAKETLAK